MAVVSGKDGSLSTSGLTAQAIRFASKVITHLHDQAIIKQTSSKHRTNVEQMSSKHRAIRAHVVHVVF